MKTLQQEFTQLPFAHHTYGIEASHFNSEEFLQLFSRDDFSYIVHRQYDMFKIADARMIKSLATEKTDKASLFILEFTFMNREAQNAMLKLLEEPATQTYFVLVFPSREKLLPTLRSRMHILSVYSHQYSQNNFVDIQAFLKLSLQERFEMIKSKTDKKNTEAITKTDVLEFLNDCEMYESRKDQSSPQVLQTIFLARDSLHANGASMKMILDMVVMHINE